MKVLFTETFLSDLLELPRSLQRKCRTLVRELADVPSDQLVTNKLPGWRLHKLHASPYASLSLDMNYRVLVLREMDCLTLHRAVKHDIADSAAISRAVKETASAEYSHRLDAHDVRAPKGFQGRAVEDLSLRRISRGDQRRFVQLDEKQLRCIDDFLAHNPRALVSGRPGTGKTLIAAEAAVRLRNEGERVIFICFTEALAHWLRAQIAGTKLEVWAIKRLAIALLELAGLDVQVPARREDWTPEFWQSVVPTALKEAGDAIKALDTTAIIVDEGQDLDADDWKLIETLAGPNSRLWIFCDPSQRLWSDREITLEKLAKYQLGNQYRCHEAIQALGALYQGESTVAIPESSRSMPLGAMKDQRIKIVSCGSRSVVPNEVSRELSRLRAEGLGRGDIAIVSLVSRTGSGSIAGLNSLDGQTLVRADDQRMSNEIVAESVYRFKGLERPAVILTDLSLRGPEEEAIRRAKMNVAVTRAQSFLRIIDTEEAFLKEPELAGLRSEI